MVLSSVMGLAALAMLAEAQTSQQATSQQVTPSPTFSTITTSGTRSATAAATASETHTIAVGASGFQFSPQSVEANVGDTIEWIFYPDGHSVIRAEYGFPCTPYEYIDIGREGFYSGPQPVKAITNNASHTMPRYRVRVNDTMPIFFYCGAPGSCFKEHMIGVINENKTQTLDGQMKAVEAVSTQILPGEPFPTESDGSTPTDGSSGGGQTVINNVHHTWTGGEIAGVAIGGLAFLLIAGCVLYCCGRRGGLRRAYTRGGQPPYHPGPPPPPGPPVTELNYAAQPKSPGDAWRNSHYSSFSNATPYHDIGSPAHFASPPISPQPTGYAHPVSMQGGYLDPRFSSIAPTVAEVPDNRAPPAVAPESAPVELPTAFDEQATAKRNSTEKKGLVDA